MYRDREFFRVGEVVDFIDDPLYQPMIKWTTEKCGVRPPYYIARIVERELQHPPMPGIRTGHPQVIYLEGMPDHPFSGDLLTHFSLAVIYNSASNLEKMDEKAG